ncbi:hypothetical protein ANN_10436 [Periplaneta americana]|uniref:NACHT domain-containing protein n=1 Tax=Periplaneta americana TaxID=6978 RepID=A0ABQ8TP38_PERAM|nr:hypothetical protein ANN_10436 [Periplaneta americana]
MSEQYGLVQEMDIEANESVCNEREVQHRVDINDTMSSNSADSGFEYRIQRQDHSEGEDSGYAEVQYTSVVDKHKTLHQKCQDVEAEIQHRLQRELHLLRQQMELKLHVERLRIEQQLRQEMLHKESKQFAPVNTFTTKAEPKSSVTVLSTNLPSHQYEKTKGFADMSGEEYEVKMAAFLFLLGFNYTDGFFLATNLKGAGAFDDIVFQYEGKNKNGNKLRRTCFIQLKHKQKDGVLVGRNELLSLQGGFSLRKLYGSFREVNGQFCVKANHKIFSGNLEDCEFCLYTNAQIDRRPMNDECADVDVYTLFRDLRAYKQLLDQLCTVTENGHDSDNMMIKEKIKRFTEEHPNKEITPKLNRIKNKPSKKEFEKLAKEISDIGDVLTHKEFLNKLTVFSNQAGKYDLDSIIEREIKLYCQVSTTQAKAISGELLKNMQDWRRNSNDYLTETSQFWLDMLQCRINLIPELSCPTRTKFEKLNIKFTHTVIKELMSNIKDSKIVNIVTQNASTLTSALKVSQGLDDFGIPSLLLTFEQCASQRNTVLSIWSSRWCKALVIDCCTQMDSNLDAVQSILDQEVLLECNCHVVIISEQSVSDKIGSDCVAIYDHCSLDQLDNASQDRVLNQKVNFQGYDVKIGSLIQNSDKLSKLVDSDILVKLLYDDSTLILGNSLADKSSVYIPRTLQCKIFIKSDILNNNEVPNIIAVSGISKRELSQLVNSPDDIGRFLHHAYYSSWFYQGPSNCRFVVFETESLDNGAGFEELCKRFHGRNVHWLGYEHGSLWWINSHGDTTDVCKYIDHSKSCGNQDHLNEYIIDNKPSSFRPNTLDDVNEKIVLVSAEPGMGKSTLLTHLAHDTKFSDPSTFVLRVNLNDHSRYLFENNVSHDDDVNTALNFLTSCANVCTSEHELETGLLKHSLLYTRNLVVLLDGFDEISPTHAKTTASLIRILSKTEVRKLWVTSRPVMRSYLQKEMNVLSLILQPFSERDQKLFLRRFWKSRRKDIDDSILNTFVKMFIEITSKTLHDKNMAGIPLHTVMLAEAYEKILIGYNCSGNIIMPEKLDLLELYETFVEKKFHIYCKEKNNMDTTKAGVNDDLEYMRESFMNNHMKCALTMFFRHTQFHSLLDKRSEIELESFISRIKSGKEKTGIIVEVNAEGIPHFVHRTFAEYFVAKWLAQNYASNRELLVHILFTQNFDVISNIFNHILARGFDLHVSVLNHDKQAVVDLLGKGVNVNETDRGGRTALHLAALEYNRTASASTDPSNIEIIAEMLLCNGIKADAVDKLLGWRALNYADKVGASWRLIERLLETDVSDKDLENIRNKLEDKEFRDKSFCEVVEQGHIQLVAFMLRNGANVNSVLISQRFKIDKYTPLHAAARYGRLALTMFLVKHGADVMARDRWGATALHRAAQYNHLEVVKYLLERGTAAREWLIGRLGSRASPSGSIANVGDEDCDTPLHYAARGGALDVVRYLIQEKLADVNACNCDGETALTVSERSVLRDGSDSVVAVASFMRSLTFESQLP